MGKRKQAALLAPPSTRAAQRTPGPGLAFGTAEGLVGQAEGVSRLECMSLLTASGSAVLYSWSSSWHSGHDSAVGP